MQDGDNNKNVEWQDTILPRLHHVSSSKLKTSSIKCFFCVCVFFLPQLEYCRELTDVGTMWSAPQTDTHPRMFFLIYYYYFFLGNVSLYYRVNSREMASNEERAVGKNKRKRLPARLKLGVLQFMMITRPLQDYSCFWLFFFRVSQNWRKKQNTFSHTLMLVSSHGVGIVYYCFGKSNFRSKLCGSYCSYI